jgi:hypothetical protein
MSNETEVVDLLGPPPAGSHTSSNSELQTLNEEELKAAVTSAWKKHEGLAKNDMAPLLYYLREKLKAQGKSGTGFGAWVEKNIAITRRTADRWANEWAIAQGLKKPPKTSGPKSKGDGELSDIVDGLREEYFSLNLLLTPSEQEELIFAWGLLGEEPATRLIYDTLTAAVKAQEPKTETFKTELGELQTVDNTTPSAKEMAFQEDGEAR